MGRNNHTPHGLEPLREKAREPLEQSITNPWIS